MRKFLFWFVALMLLAMVGSMTLVGPPAHAATSSSTVTSVYFKSIEKGIPQSIDLYHFTAKGRMWTQSVSTTRNNAGLVCPKNGKVSLAWNEEDSSVIHVLPAGQCLRAQGHIEVSVLWGR